MQMPALAQHAFIKSLGAQSNNPEAWVSLGALYLSHDQMELANRAFSQAQSLDPGKARAWVGQALVAERMGSAEALDLFRREWLSPGQPWPRSVVAHI